MSGLERDPHKPINILEFLPRGKESAHFQASQTSEFDNLPTLKLITPYRSPANASEEKMLGRAYKNIPEFHFDSPNDPLVSSLKRLGMNSVLLIEPDQLSESDIISLHMLLLGKRIPDIPQLARLHPSELFFDVTGEDVRDGLFQMQTLAKKQMLERQESAPAS